ncbi:hypothetical protein GQ53DRAFT_804086 [Thozetella sp. PMI_491]|nr:hypothetical protein GQ53DRAFT_804086 [Thozetella sp. PMI_491]
MADKENKTGSGAMPLNLSAREQEILSKAIMCLKSPPEVDYVRLAEACGMQNHRSASNAWSSIKKKLTEHGSLPATPSKEGSAKKTPSKRKTATDNGDDEESTDTPSKKTRGKKPAAVKKEEEAAATPVKKEEPPTPTKNKKAVSAKLQRKAQNALAKMEAKEDSEYEDGLADVPMLEEAAAASDNDAA